MHEKGHKLKTLPLIKNLQFSSNLADIQPKLPTHEVDILTLFHKDCKKNFDFLLTQKFLVCAYLYASPFTSLFQPLRLSVRARMYCKKKSTVSIIS